MVLGELNKIIIENTCIQLCKFNLLFICRRQSRNGSVSSRSQGILKTRTPMLGTKVLTTKPVLKRPVGTMRADQEASRKTVSSTVRQLVNPIKNLKFSEKPSFSRPIRKNLSVTGKLGMKIFIILKSEN